MRKVIYSMMVSLDGFIEGPHQEIDWHVIDEELHQFINVHSDDLSSSCSHDPLSALIKGRGAAAPITPMRGTPHQPKMKSGSSARFSRFDITIAYIGMTVLPEACRIRLSGMAMARACQEARRDPQITHWSIRSIQKCGG